MKCVVFLYALATVALLLPGGLCDEEQSHELRRNRRTVQFLVNHFVHFLGLSGPSGSAGTKKVEPKQDNVFALPLTNILKASAGKFSGFSGAKPKPTQSHREPTLQHDLPTWIENRPQKGSNPYSEAFEADSLEPTRVSLLSTTQEPEPETTSTTSTTTTEAPLTTTSEAAPLAPTDVPEEQEIPDPTTALPETPTALPEQADQSTSAPATEDRPQEEADGTSSTEAPAPIDPSAVNTLSDARVDLRTDFRDESFQPTPIPLVSYQHFVQPTAVWPGTGFQAQFPAQQYFGNNVFFPAQAQFPLAAPFQVQAPLQQSHGYPSIQPQYDNRLYYPTEAASSAKSHSRVKLHDNHYDLVTYHDDTEPAASNYQMQMFGNYQARRY